MTATARKLHATDSLTSSNTRPVFQVIFPKKDAAEDSPEILRPQQIIEKFNNQVDPINNTKFLLDHLLELVAKNWFESLTQKGADEFAYSFQTMADAIYNMEQHTADRNLAWSIIKFLELVMGKNKEEIAEVESAIDQLVDRYGSLTNGLHHFNSQRQ